jgi:hypothetical protein
LISTAAVSTPALNQYQVDVNQDKLVTALDALLVINYISGIGSSTDPVKYKADHDPNGYLDVNGDGLVTALDALLILNYINAQRV